jgi:hypothetical protein
MGILFTVNSYMVLVRAHVKTGGQLEQGYIYTIYVLEKV